MELTTYSAGPKKKEQQKMSLGAFMTDESKLYMEMSRCYIANTAQNLGPGLMRWRICQSVSISFFFIFGIDPLNNFSLLIVYSRYVCPSQNPENGTHGTHITNPFRATYFTGLDYADSIDSRAGYGAEKRTYGSTNTTFGSGNLAGSSL